MNASLFSQFHLHLPEEILLMEEQRKMKKGGF